MATTKKRQINKNSLANLDVIKTREQAVEKGRKGGIAAGRANKERKSLRQCLELVLDLETQGNTLNALRQMGIKEEDATYRVAVAMSIIKSAIGGNVKATELVAKLTGEMVEKQEITGKDGEPLSMPQMTSEELAIFMRLNGKK